jgi:glycosyltransferase involved in cell wall biosynthesis
MPTVSVIIPSYNHEKYIAEAIRSILDQTFQDFEIIITDDASTDNTVEIIKEFSDPRIQLFCQRRNQGVSRTIDFSIAKAKGKYIALLGSDDIAMTERLKKQVEFLNEHNEIGAVLSRAHIIDEEGNAFTKTDHFYYSIFDKDNRTRFEWLNYFFYQGNCLCAPSALIRKSVYEKIGRHNSCFLQLQDFDFWIRFCFHFDFFILEEKLVKYRVRDNNMNISADHLENHIRGEWEYTHILKPFFEIRSLDELLKIFPVLKNNYSNLNASLISYYVAMLCLETKTEIRIFPAIEKLYELLQTSADSLLEKANFSHADFFKILVSSDIFSFGAKCKLNQLITENNEIKTQNEILKNQIKIILNSKIWKISKPLRWLKKNIIKVWSFQST